MKRSLETREKFHPVNLLPVALAMGSDTNAPQRSEQTAQAILIDLCKQLYDRGGLPGTAGGMSVQENNYIYMSPSGVQKERMHCDDLFAWSTDTRSWVYEPNSFKPSASTSIFLLLHQECNAGAVIHTHSRNAVLASLIDGEHNKEFRISHIENIKAIPKVTEPGNLSYFDTLVIPIIENTAHEEQLEPELRQTLLKYPHASAVLVRRHGLYVWGANVWKAKIINEAIDYVLDLAIEMKKLGLPLEPSVN